MEQEAVERGRLVARAVGKDRVRAEKRVDETDSKCGPRWLEYLNTRSQDGVVVRIVELVKRDVSKLLDIE